MKISEVTQDEKERKIVSSGGTNSFRRAVSAQTFKTVKS